MKLRRWIRRRRLETSIIIIVFLCALILCGIHLAPADHGSEDAAGSVVLLLSLMITVSALRSLVVPVHSPIRDLGGARTRMDRERRKPPFLLSYAILLI